MSVNQWLLVEWVDEHNVFPKYGVVSVHSLINEDKELHLGKMIFVKSKHGNSARRGQILRISGNKHYVKEQKLLKERQDHQVKNMLSMCMRTIQEIKQDPLLYGSPNSSQQSVNGPNRSDFNATQAIDSSDSSSEEGVTNRTPCLQAKKAPLKTPAQLKRITDYYESPTNNSQFKRNRRSVISSTPLPQHKLTFDQSTQTDDLPEVDSAISLLSIEKVEQIEFIVLQLYEQFKTLLERLQIDCQDFSMHLSDEEQNGTIDSEKELIMLQEHLIEDILDDTTGQIKAPEPNSRSLQVRRVSAHTTGEQIDDDMVAIGAGNAKVPVRLMKEINWKSSSAATRRLLQAIFPRKVLATHSMTGKPSPAFTDKPAKKRLDPLLVYDIIETVSKKCGVPKRAVRNYITVKCTDEAKLYRNRLAQRSKNKKCTVPENQENVPPSPAASRVSSNGSG